MNDYAKVPHCCLYDEGYQRIGCIGCPMGGSKNMMREFERYPKYKDLYIKAMQRMVETHPGQIKVATGENAGGGTSVRSLGQMVFWWWVTS